MKTEEANISHSDQHTGNEQNVAAKEWTEK
jgi:hypothetical protein